MDALRILKERGFRRLPVMDGERLVGITTRKDLKDAMPSKATTLSVWELNYLLSKLTVGEMMTLEKHSGKVLHDFEAAVNQVLREAA